jgi:hypothetical protein
MAENNNNGSRLPVSQRAEKLLNEKAGERREEVLELATQFAMADGSRAVKEKHVQKALDVLEIGEPGTRKYTEVTGGIFLGASIESLIAMIAAGHFTAIGGIAACVLMGAGGFMLALGLRK